MTKKIFIKKRLGEILISLFLLLFLSFIVLGVPPKTYDMPIETLSDKSVNFEFATDVPYNNNLTFSLETQPSNGTISLNGKIATYTPNQGFDGKDSFTFKANNGSEDSNTSTVNIIVKKLREISIVDRYKKSVANGDTSNSTLLHIVVENNSDVEVSEYKYFYLLQDAQPTSDDLKSSQEDVFFKDLWFFRETTTQWIKIEVEFADGIILNKTVGLKGGVLDSPPDDPIDPWDYADKMGIGFDVDWHEDFSTNYIVLLKKSGFKNIRIRRATLKIKDTIVMRKLLRHGFYTIFSWFGTGESTDEFWKYYSEKTKNFSYRLMFDIFVEVLEQTPLLLNLGTKKQMKVIRQFTKKRIVALHPAGYNSAPEFHQYTEIPEESGYYIFGQWHTSWCSGISWTQISSRKNMTKYCDNSEKWTMRSASPGWDSALMFGVTGNSKPPFIGEQLDFIKKLKREHELRHIPFSINAFPRNVRYIVTQNGDWVPKFKIVYQAIQKGKVVFDPDDWDCDTLSNNDEINKYNTDPRCADTDGDNILDADEIKFGMDPLNPDDGSVIFAPPYYPSPADDDGDGIPNAFEIMAGSDPHNPNDSNLDEDNDLLTNLQEYQLQRDPYLAFKRNVRTGLADLDGDGYGAIAEYQLGRDPLKKEDPTNKIPIAAADSYTTTKDTPIIMDLLANDSDADNDSISIYEFYPVIWMRDMPAIVDKSTRKGGTLKVNQDSTVTYTPKNGYVGTDSFYYVITDNKGYSSGTVSITVK